MVELPKKPRTYISATRDVLVRFSKHENFVIGGILAGIIVVLAVITKGISATPENMRNILLQSSTRGVAAIGQAFCILTAGIDLSVGGIATLTTVLGASLMTEHERALLLGYPLSMGLTIFLMLLMATSIGTINGLSVSRLRIPPLMVTLAMWQMARGGAYQICQGLLVHGLPRSFAFIGQGIIGGVPVQVIIFVTVAAVGYFVLTQTTYGRSIYAIGGNPASAYLSGVKVQNMQFSVYVISGFLAGLAALIFLSRLMSGSLNAAVGLEIDSIAATVIGGVSLAGGRGTMIGVVIGVIIIGVINNGMIMMGLAPDLQDLVKGGVIFAAVAVDALRTRRA